MKNNALRFVVLMGIVNLFADMVYEGGRGEVGALLGSLGASGFTIGIVAGGGELIGYAVRSIAGAIADRTGKYWIDIWAGYLINQLCVPALALAGSWPAAAGLVIGERFGRGVRRPATSGLIAEAGRQLGKRGWAFGLNEALDQTGATIGPLLLALGVAHSGLRLGYGILLVPAICTLAALAVAQRASKGLTPSVGRSTLLKDSIPAISIWFAAAMGVAAIASYFLGGWLDKYGSIVVTISLIITAAASPLAFLGTGALAQAGVVLWGLGTAVQDALLVALVARVIGEKRATAFGIYDTVFGVAWFAGSALMGFLIDRSMFALVGFSVVLQLAAIPFFAGGRTQEPSLH